MSDSPIFDNIEKPTPIYGSLTGENEVPKPNMTPEKKVVAATIGAGVGTATGVILCWTIELITGVDIPAGVELAIGSVLTAGLAFVSGYFKRN